MMADNEAIRRGYRPRLSCRGAVKSLFSCHNESVNVYSHLVGSVLFIGFLVHLLAVGIGPNHTDAFSQTVTTLGDAATAEIGTLYSAASKAVRAIEEESSKLGAALDRKLSSIDSQLSSAFEQSIAMGASTLDAIEKTVADSLPPIDEGRELTATEAAEDALKGASPAYRTHGSFVPQWPVAVFILSAICCLTASATFHLFQVVDEKWFRFLARTDYASISILIVGSAVPFMHYGFFCTPHLYYTYMSLDVAANLCCVVLSLSEAFQSEAWRTTRMSMFILAGLFGAIPLTHVLITAHELNAEALYNLVIMGVLYVLGALLYGFRVPERFFPGRFDIAGASHQIFHFMVLAACLVHYFSVTGMYRWRAERNVCSSGWTL